MFSDSVANRLRESRDPTATSELQPEKAWDTRCLNIISGWGTSTEEVEGKKVTETTNLRLREPVNWSTHFSFHNIHVHSEPTSSGLMQSYSANVHCHVQNS